MGQRTSVYLSDEISAAVKASGVPLAELVRRGLGTTAAPAAGPRPRVVATDRIILRPAGCPHRGLSPGAYCRSCDSTVPERRKSGG